METGGDDLARRDADLAKGRTRRLLESAKREMGEEGEGIHIDGSAMPHASDPLGLGQIRFPSEEVKSRFLQILRRKLNPTARGL